MSELSVRRAEESDLDVVAGVWHDSASRMDGAGAAEMPPLNALRQRIDAELRSGWHLYVAVRDESVVGMLALKPEVAILDQIFVAPSEQARGVGRAMLAVAKQSMPGGFSLRMNASNDRARRFYETQGMIKLDEGIHPWTGVAAHFYGWNIR